MSINRYWISFFIGIVIFVNLNDAALPARLQNLELDDLTSLWEKFPSIINKIKEAVNRFRCPKGWRRLGGSCYYLSNLTSTPDEANQTCHGLHSNQSNLMQIRNTVELFYAAHVLTKYNLSALMIELDPTLLKGKTIAELLMDDQGRWQRMKEKFRDLRAKYRRVKERIIDELHSAGLKISRRSKKIRQTVRHRKQEFVHDDFDSNIYHDYELIPPMIENDTAEYEYDDLETNEETDEFEQLDEISGICDQIDWNVLNNQTNIYILTTYLINDKIVCSISDLDFDLDYDHLCEYVLDFCFANVVCGKHGHCVNTLAGFKCSCGFLYGGLLCERISRQGYQIIIGAILVVVLYSLSFKPVRWSIWKIYSTSIRFCKRKRQAAKERKASAEDDRKELMMKKTNVNEKSKVDDSSLVINRRLTIAEEIFDFILPQTTNPLKKPEKRDLSRLFWVGGLSITFLSILFVVTTMIHFTSFKYDSIDETKIETLANETVRLVARCEKISDYKRGNLIFFPIASVLILIFSWSVKREKKCLKVFDGRPGILPPIEPFRTANRFTTATVFGIIAFEVLKIFEELLFSTADPISHGVLVELIFRLAVVILVGLRYYPILASLQLRNIVSRFFVCLYIVADITYAIIREGSCMGFIPLSQYYSAVEEAKLRLELGTWFIVYGLIKNTPHFMFLSYIAAELFVRFAYDSIYVPLKKGRTIWSAEMVQTDEYEFAKYCVRKLFRKKDRWLKKRKFSTKLDQNNLVDHEHEENLQREETRVRRFMKRIYVWDDDFRFTTMATCTYTVALVFLYYLACTFVFLYVSRTTGHFSFLRFYIESLLGIELKGIFSLRREIIFSAIVTFLLYTGQLFLGIRSYKRHRIQLKQGIFLEVPSAQNLKSNAMAAKSVHYSGFLVGYMAWGFIICFHLIFLTTSLVSLVTLRVRYLEVILAITVPVLVFYLVKMLGTSSAGRCLFIHDSDEQLNLKNRKTYAIFVYFNFFADCFLGIASCIIRLIKATFLNIVYMARLDCSFLGRPLEKLDLGFAAYVSYLHMEATHTNPIVLAFCYSMYEDVVSRRAKQGYDDECCIGPHELDDEDEVVVVNENHSTNKVSPSVTSKEGTSTDRTSTVARLVPEKKPRLPPPSPPSRKDISPPKTEVEDDDDEDDDGGVKPPSTSTVGRLVPPEKPRLFPIENSSGAPPPVPRRADVPDEDSDDDGGIDPKELARRQRELEEKKKKKKKEKVDVGQRARDDDDDDGVAKTDKPKGKQPKKKTKPVPPPRRDDDDDDDGGISREKILAAEKKKKEAEAKKQKKQQKAKQVPVDDDDGDGVPLRPSSPPNQKKSSKTKKKSPKIVPQKDDDDDDDGGPVVKTYDTIQKIMPKKGPVLDHSSDTRDDGSLLASASTHNTVGQIVPNLSKEILQAAPLLRKASPPKRMESHYDTIPTEEERAARATYVSYSPPSYNQASEQSDLPLLRTISYREAQQSTPPIVQRRSTTLSSSNRSQSVTNEDSSHYSEINSPTDENRGIVNRSYSTNGSNQSSKLSSQQGSREETVQEETEDTEIDSEEDVEDEEDEDEVSQTTKRGRSPIPNISTSFATIAHLVKPNEAKEKERILKRKQAKFRWQLAYTILNNYHLFDLRKHAQSRLALLHINRSNLMDEERRLTGQVPQAMAAVSVTSDTSPSLRQRTVPSTTTDQRSIAAPPPSVRLLSVPTVPVDDFPQSPAERYIAIRSCMLYDVNGQPLNLLPGEGVSQTPSVASQWTPSQKKSVGFLQPSSRAQRPVLERETLPMTVTTINGTPIFQPVPESVQSTADYPMTGASNVTNLSTLRSQMSHAQHMQAWRQEKMKKIQKKQSHCYYYGPPVQRTADEKVAAAAILTPRVIVTSPSEAFSPEGQRLPSQSPFQYPKFAKKTNQKTPAKTTTSSSDRDDDRTTNSSRALIHDRDTEKYRSNQSEV